MLAGAQTGFAFAETNNLQKQKTRVGAQQLTIQKLLWKIE
jgi:hypothetical protein